MGAQWVISVVACVMICIDGCGNDADGRLAIEGTVTFKGSPLDNGSIEFTPLESPPAGVAETKSGAPIMAGQFTIPAINGLMPGKYRVRITAGSQTDVPDSGGLPVPGGPSGVERIPAEYNVKSQLEATVTAAGPNTFSYEIP